MTKERRSSHECDDSWTGSRRIVESATKVETVNKVRLEIAAATSGSENLLHVEMMRSALTVDTSDGSGRDREEDRAGTGDLETPDVGMLGSALFAAEADRRSPGDQVGSPGRSDAVAYLVRRRRFQRGRLPKVWIRSPIIMVLLAPSRVVEHSAPREGTKTRIAPAIMLGAQREDDPPHATNGCRRGRATFSDVVEFSIEAHRKDHQR